MARPPREVVPCDRRAARAEEEEAAMPKFVISPHFRLQEWVAEEKGYFAAEGLDYEFREAIGTKDAKRQNLGDRVGANQTIERGRQCDVSAACHWTINVAASDDQGQLHAH